MLHLNVCSVGWEYQVGMAGISIRTALKMLRALGPREFESLFRTYLQLTNIIAWPYKAKGADERTRLEQVPLVWFET